MTRPTKLIKDCATGEETIVEFTDAEIAEYEAMNERIRNEQAQAEAEAQAKAEAKASAEAKLAALGLTPEEIAALSK